MKIFLLNPISTAPHCPNKGFHRTSPSCDTWSCRTCTCNCRAPLPNLCSKSFILKLRYLGAILTATLVAQLLVVWCWGKNEVKLSKTREQSFTFVTTFLLCFHCTVNRQLDYTSGLGLSEIKPILKEHPQRHNVSEIWVLLPSYCPNYNKLSVS